MELREAQRALAQLEASRERDMAQLTQAVGTGREAEHVSTTEESTRPRAFFPGWQLDWPRDSNRILGRLAGARRAVEQAFVPDALGHRRSRHRRQLIGEHLRVGLLVAAHELELNELRGQQALHVGGRLLHVGHRERLQALAHVP